MLPDYFFTAPGRLPVFFITPRKEKMMLTLTATVKNLYPTNEFKDSKTGEITPAGFKVQLEYSEFVKGKNGQKDGEKIVLKDFNIRNLGEVYSKFLGKLVAVPAGIYVDEHTRKPAIYIPEGSLPTPVANSPKI